MLITLLCSLNTVEIQLPFEPGKYIYFRKAHTEYNMNMKYSMCLGVRVLQMVSLWSLTVNFPYLQQVAPTLLFLSVHKLHSPLPLRCVLRFVRCLMRKEGLQSTCTNSPNDTTDHQFRAQTMTFTEKLPLKLSAKLMYSHQKAQ